jgi:hypothetical protein
MSYDSTPFHSDAWPLDLGRALAFPQRRHRCRRLWQRSPSDDGAGALAGTGVVRNPGKPPAQLAVLLVDSADGGGIVFGDYKHPWMMGIVAAVGKRLRFSLRTRCRRPREIFILI